MIKKHIKILIALLSSMIIIISPCASRAVEQEDGGGSSTTVEEGEESSDKTQDKTEEKSDDKEDNSTEDEIKMYTIEEIIFNKIPVLNVNVFNTSDTKEDSIAMRIRTTVATWYVSIRNISIVLLAFVLVYIGIRMSMATVASDRANYKKMLINWISAVLIVFFIHFIMIAVFYINDTLISMLDKSNKTSDLPIYETIRLKIFSRNTSSNNVLGIVYL